jgi:hypothetical protein
MDVIAKKKKKNVMRRIDGQLPTWSLSSSMSQPVTGPTAAMPVGD